MKEVILLPLSILLWLYPGSNFAQVPDMGTAANFVFFSTAGAISNTGISYITGNVGTNTGAITSFSNIDGIMHSPNGTTAICATDLQNAYAQLNAAIPSFFPGAIIGNGATLTAGVYSIPAAGSVNNTLVLDGEGNENAVFIFQVGGAFSSGAGADIKLVNCARASNVFWKIEGAVSLAAGTLMKGTIIANNAAISIGTGVTLEGRAFSTTGAVAVNNVLAFLPDAVGMLPLTGPVSPNLASAACYSLFSSNGLVANTGITTIAGNIGTNTGMATGYNPLLVNGTIHTVPNGATSTCAADLVSAYNYLSTLPYDIELLYPLQFGNNLVLTPHTYIMNGAVTLTGKLFLDAKGNANAVFVIRTMGALVSAINAEVVLVNGAQARNVYWQVEGAVTINNNSIFKGTIVCHNAAVVLTTGTQLEGRAFTTTGALTTTAITVSALPSATISYAVYTYCANAGFATVTFSGTSGGIYSSTTGLIINPATGAVNLGLSTPGSYLVTYSVIAAGGCLASFATTNIAIATAPSATISYPGSPFCSNTGLVAVAFSGSPSGTYASSPAGISINNLTGLVDLGASTPGTYSITYTITTCAGGCGISNYTTSTVMVISPDTYTWMGGVSANWNTPGNWVNNLVPAISCANNVTILAGAPYQPTLSSGTAAIRNIIITAGTILTISNATLQLSGTIVNSGTFNVSDGAIELNGAAAQIIPANAFQNNALKDLIISNSSNAGVILGAALDVYGSLTYTGTGKKLTTNDFLSLKSSATNTAWVGDMTGNTISGKVTIERYISANKAWRFLSIPANTTQTIRQAWQEGASNDSLNPVPGFGIKIIGPGDTTAGFDLYAGTPSMKTYNATTNGWQGISATSDSIKATGGYMVFVRGDRAATTFASAATQTVLRTKGNLFTGDQAPIIVAAASFGAIGNPYASSLDMRYITKLGIKDFFYLWDPNIGGYYGLGGYQTFSYNGSDYEVTPGLGSYGATGSISNFIQSGQAFFVEAAPTGGSVTLTEAAKSSGSVLVSKVHRQPEAKLRTNLYSVNADNSTYILDGILNNYSADYSNDIDEQDGIKLTNSGENLSIKRDNRHLIIERRNIITVQDTIFFNLAGIKIKNYQFGFFMDNFQPNIISYLEDSYLNTRTLLNAEGTTTINFSVTNVAGSYAANRFSIVFTQATILSLPLTKVKAYQQNKHVAVQWETANESNLKQYEVDRSSDGLHYTTAATVSANNTTINNYKWLDEKPIAGFNYYRIKSISINNVVKYSEVVKVFIGTSRQEITVYPNPVTNNMINLQLVNQPAGNYKVKLLTNTGQQVSETVIQHAGGSTTELISTVQHLPKGIYQLQVIKPGGNVITNKLIY